MNSRNPIDDIFKNRLRDAAFDAPEHLWDRIDGARSGYHRMGLLFVRFWPWVLGFVLIACAGFALLQWRQNSDRPDLRAFPIPTQPALVATLKALPPKELAVIEPIRRFTTLDSRISQARIDPAPAHPVRPNPVVHSEKTVQHTGGSALPPRATGGRSVPEIPPIGGLPSEQIVLNDPKCGDFETTPWRLYAELGIGPQIGFSSLSTANEEFNDHLTSRRATESPAASYRAGIGLTAVSPRGWVLRAGLQYQQINEQFDYTDNNEEKITITNVFGPNGEIIGTDTIVETTTRRLASTNRYQVLDLPLSVGYQLEYDQWAFAFHGGASLNFLIDAKGDFLAPGQQRPEAFATGANEVYRRRIGLSLFTGLGVFYQLQPGLELQIEPQIQYTPTSFTQNDYALNHRLLTTGISIGLRKQI